MVIGMNHPPSKDQDLVKCDLCDKHFTRAYNMESHRRTHFSLRPFPCTVCGRTFTRMHDQRRHESLHYDAKTYHCGGQLPSGGGRWGCGKGFARAETLNRHLQSKKGRACLAGAPSCTTLSFKPTVPRPRVTQCGGSRKLACKTTYAVGRGKHDADCISASTEQRGEQCISPILSPDSEGSYKSTCGFDSLSYVLTDPSILDGATMDLSTLSPSIQSTEDTCSSDTPGPLHWEQNLDAGTMNMSWPGAYGEPLLDFGSLDPAQPMAFLPLPPEEGYQDTTWGAADKQGRLNDWLTLSDMSSSLWPEWNTGFGEPE